SFDFNWGWFCGLYLAEGSITRKKIGDKTWTSAICFSISVDEQKRFTQCLARAVGGDQYVGVRRATSKTRVLVICDAMLARWIEQYFRHTDSKRIPDWVWHAGREFARGLVAGYLEGDGHIPADVSAIMATSICL